MDVCRRFKSKSVLLAWFVFSFVFSIDNFDLSYDSYIFNDFVFSQEGCDGCVSFSQTHKVLTVEVSGTCRNTHLLSVLIFNESDYFHNKALGEQKGLNKEEAKAQHKDPVVSYHYETTYLEMRLATVLEKGTYVARVHIADRDKRCTHTIRFEM